MELVKHAVRAVREKGAVKAFTTVRQRMQERLLRLRSDYHRDNLRAWKELAGAYRGQRAFLIGNGPSLNLTPLHLLEGENTLCFNRFNVMFERLAWRPTMYMNVDPLVATDMAGEIADIIPQVRYTFLPDYHYDEGGYFRGRFDPSAKVHWLYRSARGFRTDLPYYWAGGTVAFAGLQVLAFMGFDPIYLVGVDMTYRIHETARDDGRGGIVAVADDDPNHFDPRYFGKGRNYHQPHQGAIAMMDRAFAWASRHARQNGISVLNATLGGALEHFPRVDLRELLGVSPAEERARVDRAVRAAAGGAGLDEVMPRATTLSSPAAWTGEDRFVQADEETGFAVVKRALFTHIPIGPFEGRYLFIRR